MKLINVSRDSVVSIASRILILILEFAVIKNHGINR